MSSVMIPCARCASGNHSSERFCGGCGLPLGAGMPDAVAGSDALGPFEAPEPDDPDAFRLIREFVVRSGFESGASSHGWRMLVPLPLDRHQAVYVGYAGIDPEGRSILSLVSVCGPSNARDTRIALKLNAKSVEGHFAIKVLRGEEYFVVIQNVPSDTVETIDAGALVRRIAETADSFEERLSRGRDLY
jgi:hypothetical protein